MFLRKYSSVPRSLLLIFVLVVKLEFGLCIFQSWFRNGNTPNNFSLALTQSLFAKRQATPTDPSSGAVDITSAPSLMEFGQECEINGMTCNHNNWLECIDGKCMCKNPMSHAFDEDLNVCVALSGSQCGTGKPQCVKNSQCIFGSCQCLDKYGETTTKVCMMNHQQPCRPGECNADLNLACMKGTCQCIDSTLVFDPFGRKCVNPQQEFDKFTKTIGRDVVQRVIARTVSDATSLVFLPFRLLVPGFGWGRRGWCFQLDADKWNDIDIEFWESGGWIQISIIYYIHRLYNMSIEIILKY